MSNAEMLPSGVGHFLETCKSAGPVEEIIVATSYLDGLLQQLLMRYFLEGSSTSDNLLKPVTGPLANLKTKSDLVYCLGLISKGAYKNLRTIAEIRNQVAHKTGEHGFGHPSIDPLCRQLTLRGHWKKSDLQPDDPDYCGNRFSVTCVSLYIYLDVRFPSCCKPLTDDWDQ
jgi:hypothetical protein